jgi:hypothetical protein
MQIVAFPLAGRRESFGDLDHEIASRRESKGQEEQ